MVNDTTVRDRSKNDHKHELKEALVAVFESREEARAALGALHKAHFRKTWFGTTSLATDSQGDQTLTAESAGLTFKSQESKGLVDALVAHGISGAVARTIESEIEPGDALVTIEVNDRDPAEAIAIVEEHGGRADASGVARATGMPAGTTSAPRVRTVREEVDAMDAPVWEEEMFFARGRR